MAKTQKPSSGSSANKANASDKEFRIKYSEKSAGQPELVIVFNEISKLMKPYEKGNMLLLGGDAGKIALVSKKETVIGGRKRTEIDFAAAIVQKGYVGFYFMPVYTNTALQRQLAPELLRCLKGKACFHIKKPDPQLLDHIGQALRIGFECYKKLGWA